MVDTAVRMIDLAQGCWERDSVVALGRSGLGVDSARLLKEPVSGTCLVEIVNDTSSVPAAIADGEGRLLRCTRVALSLLVGTSLPETCIDCWIFCVPDSILRAAATRDSSTGKKDFTAVVCESPFLIRRTLFAEVKSWVVPYFLGRGLCLSKSLE